MTSPTVILPLRYRCVYTWMHGPSKCLQFHHVHPLLWDKPHVATWFCSLQRPSTLVYRWYFQVSNMFLNVLLCSLLLITFGKINKHLSFDYMFDCDFALCGPTTDPYPTWCHWPPPSTASSRLLVEASDSECMVTLVRQSLRNRSIGCKTLGQGGCWRRCSGGCLGLLPIEEYVYIYINAHSYNHIITTNILEVRFISCAVSWYIITCQFCLKWGSQRSWKCGQCMKSSLHCRDFGRLRLQKLFRSVRSKN